jgi:putative transposase
MKGGWDAAKRLKGRKRHIALDIDGLLLGFVVQPRRWVVERSAGWFGRCRGLSKDYEALPEVSEAMVTLAAIRLMLHRLAHPNRRRLPTP